MKVVEVVDKFNLLIKGLAEKKEEFCNNPGKDFSRKRKQDFEQIIRSSLSLDGGALTNEILRIHKYSSDHCRIAGGLLFRPFSFFGTRKTPMGSTD